MKKTIVAVALGVFSLSAMGQGVDFGIRAGVNFPGMNVDDFAGNSTFESLESSDRQMGFHVGVAAQIDALILFVEPQVTYTHLNHELVATTTAGEETTLEIMNSRIDIPVLIGKELGPVRLFVAPMYSVNIGNSDANFDNGSFGYQAGVGLALGDFILDVKYEGGFGEVANDLVVANTQYDANLQTDQIIISLGYNLF